MNKAKLLAGAGAALAAFGMLSVGPASAQTTLNIATVNNSDMIIMQKLSPKFEAATGIKLNWVVLEENVLRQRVTTDIATKGGQFDIMTIGSYEAPIWGKLGWLDSVDDLGDAYDYKDLIPQVKDALSANGKMYAVPFYAESSFTFYRKDLFDKAGIAMPDKPTYDQIAEYAEQAYRQEQGAVWRMPARQAGLGREHGVLRHTGQRLRRPVVRHAMEAAVDFRRMEVRDEVVSQRDGAVRASGGHGQRS